VEVTSDGAGLVSQASSTLLAQLANKSGLDTGAVAQAGAAQLRAGSHERGRATTHPGADPADPAVVRELHVPDRRPVLPLSLRSPQIHAHRTTTTARHYKLNHPSRVPTLFGTPEDKPERLPAIRPENRTQMPINCGTRVSPGAARAPGPPHTMRVIRLLWDSTETQRRLDYTIGAERRTGSTP